MPQLDPTWFASQLFWLAVAFSLLYAVLSRFVLPPLMEVMARRAQAVEEDIASAQRCKTEADIAKQDYERALAEAKGRAQALLSEAMAELKVANEAQAREMDQTIATKLQEAQGRIESQKQAMITALGPTTAELTAMIVQKLTQVRPASERVSEMLGDMTKVRR